MEFKPYIHQKAVSDSLLKCHSQIKLLFLVTGAGKTGLFFYHANLEQNKNKKFLFIAPQIALAHQTAKYPYDVGLLQGRFARNLDSRLVVGTIKTVNLRMKNEKFTKKHWDLSNFDEIWIDEAHLEAEAIAEIRESLKSNQKIVYLTGTPYDKDERYFPHLVEGEIYGKEFDYNFMIENSYLVPSAVYHIGTIDTSDVSITKGGDFSDVDLLDKIKASRVNVPKTIMSKIDKNFPTVVIAQNIKHADSLAKDILNAYPNLKVRVIHSKSKVVMELPAPLKDRVLKGAKAVEYILDEMRSFKVDITIAVHMLTKGIDVPSIGNIILATKIRQRSTLTQIFGRGARNGNGKDGTKKMVCRVIDIFGSVKDIGHPYDPFDPSFDKPNFISKSKPQCKICDAVGSLMVLKVETFEFKKFTTIICKDCGSEEVKSVELPNVRCPECFTRQKENPFTKNGKVLTSCVKCGFDILIEEVITKTLDLVTPETKDSIIRTAKQVANKVIPEEHQFPFFLAFDAFAHYTTSPQLSFVIEKILRHDEFNYEKLVSRMHGFVSSTNNTLKELRRLYDPETFDTIVGRSKLWESNPSECLDKLKRLYQFKPKNKSFHEHVMNHSESLSIF